MDGQPLSRGAAPLVHPLQVGRYRIEQYLGSGAFGAVYLAQDYQMERAVAVKVAHAELTMQPGRLAGCLMELRRAAAVSHPNIVPVFEVGSTETHPCFVVCRYIEGTTLTARMRHSRPSHAEAMSLVATVADALHTAHQRKLVHGDIHPGNLLLDTSGHLFVSDFSPTLVCGEQLAGTPAYMSPEQIRGEEHRIDARSDIFSLGVVFYELLTGRRPFAGESYAELAEAVSAAEPTPPRHIDAAIPVELERVCLKMLRRRIEERYASAQELADDLRHTPVQPGFTAASAPAGGPQVSRSTVLFTDFKGFTERVRILEQTAGPRAAAEMKRTVANYVEEALRQIADVPAAKHRLLDTAGDGFFFHFDVAEGAYRFAAALNAITTAHNRNVTDDIAKHWFRTGVATGAVAWDGDRPVGNIINVCSRHQAACVGGDLLIDDETFNDLPAEFRGVFGPPETILDKHDAAYVVRRTTFGQSLAAPEASPPTAPHGPQDMAHVGDAGPAAVVPRGLRSFSASDSDFFLELVPGPRNRQGIPDIIRLMKERIESRDPYGTFTVGCVYGPSGCGKSSLVKAGLLPRLAPTIITIAVEASADETELVLISRLRTHFPHLPENCSLTTALTMLRRGTMLSEGGKVLIVIDQFEQWLQAKGADHDSDLATALRQCDGLNVQCFVMVRDDFWVAVNRFMRELDIRLIERVNSVMIDLFDVDHAAWVLASFGRAYGRLPGDSAAASGEQQQFLQDAVAGLAVDGKVVPVRLALFAEIMKNKQWTPSVLRKLGGASGVGVAFLEETFSTANSSVRYRHHQQAARNVLKSLLPDDDTTIRRRRSVRELMAASGYEKRPEDFADLRNLLDGELRLITATACDGFEAPDTGAAADADAVGTYQLAHDFLVPSLREWLTRGQKETPRGRAELLLADRAAVWSRRPENRQLPSLWQWLQIRWWTRPRDWTGPQQAMMRKAATYHAGFLITVVCLAIALNYGRIEVRSRNKSVDFVDRLIDAKTAELPTIIAEMTPYRRWLDPLLRKAAIEARQTNDLQNQLAIALALLPVDASQIEPLHEQLVAAEPADVEVIIGGLKPHKKQLAERLWREATDPDSRYGARRLRAAAALAAYDPDNQAWHALAAPIANLLVEENPLVLHHWIDCFFPVRRLLEPRLNEIYRPGLARPSRIRAASLLGGFLADDPAALTDVMLDGYDGAFALLFPKIVTFADKVKPLLVAEIDRPVAAHATEEVKEHAAMRKAYAAVALLRFNEPERVWPLLSHSPDPRIRSHLIEYLANLGTDAVVLAHQLDVEPDVEVRRALLLSLGSFAEGNIPPAVRTSLLPKVKELYASDPDPGIHATCEWTLRRWHEDDWLTERNEAWRRESRERSAVIIAPLARGGAGPPQWYVNDAGQTMVVIPGPVEFSMGSPRDEANSNISDPSRPKRIGRTYAIANKQVTVEQYKEFDATYQVPAAFTRLPNLPAVRISWHMAAAYCNDLSRREGIPAAEWCYERAAGAGTEMLAKKNLLSLRGYRLPTEAEMEYSNRAGAVTERHFGESNDLLAHYAWYASNSQGMTWPVGTLKPNDLGLFDTLGNVLEWSQNVYHIDAQRRSEAALVLDDIEDEADTPADEAINIVFRSQRGGSFVHSRWESRSAARTNYSLLDERADYFGFRVARTIAVVVPPPDRQRPPTEQAP